MQPKNIAVILSAGSGSRFGSDTPKQYLKLAGKMVIEHTIEVFENCDLIDEICIVINENFKCFIENLVLSKNYKKVKKILCGGKERYHSSLSAINAYDNEELNLIFHDAVRPFVNDSIIKNIIKALENFAAVDVAIPATDTIIEVNNNIISNIPNRDFMMQGQTPQAFKLKTIKKAYESAIQDPNFKVTDDCGVVKKYLPNEKIFVVKGSLENIKITYKQDLQIADKIFLFENKKNIISNNQELFFKENLNNKVFVIFGGSQGIGKAIANLATKYNSKVDVYSRNINNIDVANELDVKKALQNSYTKYEKIDYVVNTAAILEKSFLLNTDSSTIRKIINTNYIGTINIAKYSCKFLENSCGQLLNFTSSSYTRGRAGYSIYSSTKAAIVNLTQALAEEFVFKNIRVNCINPQRTLTPMRIKNFGNEDKRTLLDPKNVAIVSLNTLLSNFTGQIIDVTLENDK